MTAAERKPDEINYVVVNRQPEATDTDTNTDECTHHHPSRRAICEPFATELAITIGSGR